MCLAVRLLTGHHSHTAVPPTGAGFRRCQVMSPLCSQLSSDSPDNDCPGLRTLPPSAPQPGQSLCCFPPLYRLSLLSGVLFPPASTKFTPSLLKAGLPSYMGSSWHVRKRECEGLKSQIWEAISITSVHMTLLRI